MQTTICYFRLTVCIPTKHNGRLGFGIFVSLEEPTKGMRADAAAAGLIEVAGIKYQAIQILAVADILKGTRPKLPLIDPRAAYKKATATSEGIQSAFDV
jgi:hypothetical protein